MLQRLPVRVDPYRLAEQGQVLEAVLDIDKMPRISALADASPGHGQVKCELKFHKIAGDSYLSGKVSGSVRQTCQRCLEDFDLPVSSDFSLLLVADDQMAERVQKYAEPLIIENDELELATFIEDELLLAIPVIARHDDLADCHAYQQPVTTEITEAPVKENPFAVLEQLKKH